MHVSPGQQVPEVHPPPEPRQFPPPVVPLVAVLPPEPPLVVDAVAVLVAEVLA
jgi:hypothetical protein